MAGPNPTKYANDKPRRQRNATTTDDPGTPPAGLNAERMEVESAGLRQPGDALGILEHTKDLGYGLRLGLQYLRTCDHHVVERHDLVFGVPVLHGLVGIGDDALEPRVARQF